MYLKEQLLSNKRIVFFLCLSLFWTVITICFRDIPFFWDSAHFSEQACYFYEHGFAGFISTKGTDTGMFPLFAVYLTLGWKLLGKTLASSHFLMLPFLIGISWEYLKLMSRYVSPKVFWFGIVLLMADPVIVTQAIVMSYDVPLLYFFLLSVNMLLSGRRVLYAISLLLLFFSGVRGSVVGISVAFIHLLMLLREFSPRMLLYYVLQYIPTISLLLLWFMYHHNETGWYLFSPQREHDEESFANIGMMFRQLLFMKWKLMDFGRVALWLLAIGYFFVNIKQEDKKYPHQLLILLLAPMFLLMITMALINNPVGHKYFLTVFLVLCILVCYALERIEKLNVRITIFSLLVLMLLGGNFWMYPQKYGNGWDSSLKVLPYFKLQNELRLYCKQNNIAPHDVAVGFPLNQDPRYTYLTNDVMFAEEEQIGESTYFVYSSVYNPRDVNLYNQLKSKSKLMKTFRGGDVVVELYKR